MSPRAWISRLTGYSSEAALEHDLAGLRDHLVGHGVEAGEICDGTPGPKQEMRVFDPDGYVLMIARSDPDA